MAHNDLGAQLLELNRLDEAEKQLRLALEIDPAAFNPTINLGIVLLKKHEIQSAIAVLEKATFAAVAVSARKTFFSAWLCQPLLKLSGQRRNSSPPTTWAAINTPKRFSISDGFIWIGAIALSRVNI